MTSRRLAIGLAVTMAALCPVFAVAQAPPSLMSARVAYMTRKAQVNPQGELKEKLDAIERDAARAQRLGRTGEMRRLVAQGMALLNGAAWSEERDFAVSLVLRADRTIADSSKPIAVRLEQIYTPAIELTRSLSARVSLRKRGAPAGGQAPAGAAASAAADVVVRDFGTFEGVGRDLRDTPLVVELDLAGIEDGPYRVRAEVLDQDRLLGTAFVGIVVRKGLDQALERLDTAAGSLPDAVRGEVQFPGNYVRNVNLSRIPIGAFDVARELAVADDMLAAAKGGKDPFAGRTGDLRRHYLFKPAGEILPYRLYVPTGYDGKRAWPLVVALHGLGATEDSFFDGYERRLPALAERLGFIVAAPRGYRVDGFYGWGVGAAPEDGAARILRERSEQDVMEVLAQVKRLYRVDDQRVYLMGHSMGAIGTWQLAAKFPEIWAAIGPFSGSGAPATVEKMRAIPEIVVHGDADLTVPVAASRAMVAEMKRLGVEVNYIEVPGGSHLDVVAPNLQAVLEFFDAHRKVTGPGKVPKAPGNR